MAGSSLLALIDDIATLLDDVSVMTKVAVKKTAGVLGDDLALNAYQVTGITANRELPVVWKVAVGSLVNKAILVPLALLISAFTPWAVHPLLMIGGIYLCFEGIEKLVHRWLHRPEEEEAEHKDRLEAITNPDVDMVAFEKERIRGAIRTDFVLSAEIIVISLGAVADKEIMTRVGVLIAISMIMTVGVYGLVAGIVKMDDAGVYLLARKGESPWKKFKRGLGAFLIRVSPILLKFLSIAGTVAMFLVGGHIIVEGIGPLHHAIEDVVANTKASAGGFVGTLLSMFLDLLVGLLAGAIAVAAWTLGKKVLGKRKPNDGSAATSTV
jgi:uncharacterized protein